LKSSVCSDMWYVFVGRFAASGFESDGGGALGLYVSICHIHVIGNRLGFPTWQDPNLFVVQRIPFPAAPEPEVRLPA
jgi:hypothetical protein